MTQATLIFPHQLHPETAELDKNSTVYLVEEHLFFSQYKFHKQKIAFHRATMKFYENYLKEKRFEVIYIEAQESISDIRKLIPELAKKGITKITFRNPTDYNLEKRLNEGLKANQTKIAPVGLDLHC